MQKEDPMRDIQQLYRPSLAALTDLYQLTMAYGYWKHGMHEREAAFYLTSRQNPFKGGFTVCCGLERIAEFLEGYHFEEEDISYLRELCGGDGKPLFEEGFLDWLRDLRFTGTLDAAPEGTVVFAHEPLLRVTGPMALCQLIETPLLNFVNYSSLVATKAARICLAAAGEPVLEFGLRRAQGVDGGLTASRSAYIGGCAATSNVLAGRIYGIPVKGTHAHSWVMCFDTELEAFERYAEAMPNNCVFLVDTYDTVRGVQRAVEVATRLRERGHEMAGIRLDSGDLAWLSKEARRILDEGGFPNAFICASNDLDEHIISSLKREGATITVWGVGTRLATAYDQPALGGVYKLSAIRDEEGVWQPKIKLSEHAIKVTNPGLLQVHRHLLDGEAVGDMILDELHAPEDAHLIIDPMDATRHKHIPEGTETVPLLEPVFRDGQLINPPPDAHAARERLHQQLDLFYDGIKRFVNPHEYPVGLESGLHGRKTKMILAARQHPPFD
jgi:nicotinate phosphoribosyltransferase